MTVGLSLRPRYALELLRARDVVGEVEIVAEACAARTYERLARAMSEVFPCTLHGIRTSLGSADGLDVDRARALGKLARALGVRAVTEHVAFVRSGSTSLAHLTPIPYSRDAVRVVARNVAALRRRLPDVPLALENVAWTMRLPDDEMSEGDFYAEVVAATGCPLLLDVANVYANAQNAGVAPRDLLASYPLEAVMMMHVAGGKPDAGGFYVDSHADPLPRDVDALVAAALLRTGAVPILLERDEALPAFAELRAELERCRALLERTTSAPRPAPPLTRAPCAGDLARFATRQRELAELLTSRGGPGPFEAAGVDRTRRVLAHKAAHARHTEGGGRS